MSRVYNVMTGATRPAAPPVAETPDEEGVWEADDEAPFVEIGGPSGPVFSPTPAAPSTPSAPVSAAAAPVLPKTTPEAKPESKPDATRTFPRLAPPPAPAYLSVHFHDIVSRAARLAADGPDASLVTLHFPEHPVSGEYRVLRDEIRKQLPETTPRVLHFTATAAEAGTTTVLLNFAITLAAHSKARVLVVDANINRPAFAAKLALKPAPGLCEVLTHQLPLAWALQPSPVPSLQVLTAGDAADTTPAAIARDFPKLVGQLRQWFDWVLVDGGVWGTLPDRDATCPSADAVYLVTRDTDTDRPEFLGVRGWVKELGGLLRGYVATRV